jgi:hypothetical protein
VLAEGATVGFAGAFDSEQQGGVEGIGFAGVSAFAGTHALLFFACGFLGHDRGSETNPAGNG